MNEAAKPHNNLIDYPPFFVIKKLYMLSRTCANSTEAHIEMQVSPYPVCSQRPGRSAAVWRTDGEIDEVCEDV